MAKRTVRRPRRPRRWSAAAAYRSILERHGTRSSQERAFWHSRCLASALSAKLAARLLEIRRAFELREHPPGSFDAMFAAAEPYRGRNMYLAVSRDGKPPEVLAADADAEKVCKEADATGRRYVLMGSPPPADAPVQIPIFNA